MWLPNLLATKTGRQAAFFLLYVTEGIPLGFTATAVATQMRRQGLTPSQIGLFVGTLYLPWAWKWVVGPVVDLVSSEWLGRRRAWIVAMQVLMVATLLVMMPVDFSRELRLFTLVVLALNAFGATQDVAIDALAVGVLGEDERGLANGLMFAGAYSGQALGGAGVLFLAGYVGFPPTFIFVAGCVLLVTVFVALPMREREAAGPPEASEGDGALDGPVAARVFLALAEYLRDALKAFFGSRASVAALAFALLPAGAYSLSLALQSNLAVELGLSDGRIGLLALVSTLISAAGCVVGGYLSDRFGRRRMLALYLVGTAIPTAALGVVMHRIGWIMPIDPTLSGRPLAPEALLVAFWAANVVFAVFQGLMYGTRTALFMDICDVDVAATQFTAYMAVLNFVIFYSGWW
jgi:MFS transporter, PAT family, beta-lactamase induction signal transducer AmpG